MGAASGGNMGPDVPAGVATTELAVAEDVSDVCAWSRDDWE